MDRGGVHFERGSGVYVRLAPPDHDRVCWAAAIGRAMRGRWEHGEESARLALEMLADGWAVCRYGAKRQRRRGRRQR